MEGQKCDWANAHARLWTSFKSTQEGNTACGAREIVDADSPPTDRSARSSNSLAVRDITASILTEVMRREGLDGPVFTEQLESRITWLLETEGPDSPTHDLLAAIVHLKKRIESSSREPRTRTPGAVDAVEQILYHLTGRRGSGRVAEGVGTGASRDTHTESSFLNVLMHVEKCKKAARKVAERCGICKSYDRESSLEELLKMMSARRPSSTEESENEDNNEMLRQVMDILGAPPGAPPDRAPALVLELTKDLEFARRDLHTCSALLHQYEKTALAKFTSCGVVSPPTVEHERALLLGGTPKLNLSPNDQWIEKPFKAMTSMMTQVNQRCHLNVVPSSLKGWPTNSSADAVLDHLRTSLESARDLMATLSERERDARSTLAETIRKLRRGDCNTSGDNDDGCSEKLSDDSSVSEENTIVDMAQQLCHLVDRQLQASRRVNQEDFEAYRRKLRESLLRILRWIPDGDESARVSGTTADPSQTAFPEDGEDALATYVEGVVRRHVSQSTIPESLVPHIQGLCNNLSQLTESLVCGNVRCVDDSTMTTLVAMVDQLRRWVIGDGCDTRSAADNVLIQKCLCELAQLLPTGTTPSSCEGTVEIEPPVDNLLEMVQLLKRRQEQWVQEQQKHHASGASSRMEKARLEEAVRESMKQLVKRCKEILLISTNSLEAEAVIDVLSDEFTDETAAAKEGSTDGTQGNGHGNAGTNSLAPVAAMFGDLDERLKIIKMRHHRLQHAYEANKVRLDNLIQSNVPRGKRWVRICNTVGAVCRAVGLEDLAFRLEHDGRSEPVQPSSVSTTPAAGVGVSPAAVTSAFKQTLRADAPRSDGSKFVTDGDLLEALKVIESRLKDDTALCERVSQQSRLLSLQEERKRWREEVVTFRQAIQVILQRLAEAGQRIKRSLYLLGTDECAEDDVVETVLRERDRRDGDEGSRGKGQQGEVEADDLEGEQNGIDEERLQKQQDVNEEALAVLLRKFGRWATRLHETTEDHLHTQRKLLKYFAAVHRFFCNTGSSALYSDSDTEALLDIDTTLMHFADGILPVLDRAIDAAQSKKKRRVVNATSGSKALLNILNGGGGGEVDTGGGEPRKASSGGEDDTDTRKEAMSLLMQNAPSDRILPADHRITRLYELVGKLRTMVAGLLSVRYLAIPVAIGGRNGSGSSDELVFADGFADDSYIELDLNTLKSVGGGGGKDGTSTAEGDRNCGSGAAPRDKPSENDCGVYITDEKLLHIVESNVTAVYQALGKFSTDYKLAAILLQKDTESMQHFIADMLRYYVELDVKRGFGQDPEMLRELYVLIHERAKRQRGCYFFSRVGGEGPCVWSTALEQISHGFTGILEKLHKRTETAAELRELVDDVVDICAMYVNWVDTAGAAITSCHPLPEDVSVACIRQDDFEEEGMTDKGRDEGLARGKRESDKYRGALGESDVEAAHSPVEEGPRPPLPPNQSRPKVSHFKKDDVVLKVIAHMFQVAQEVITLSGSNNDKTQQLEEQLQLLRERVAVAEQGRDKALSEAAVSRAELRRWRKQYHVPDDQLQPPPPLSLAQKQHEQKKSGELEALVATSPTAFSATLDVARSGAERIPAQSSAALDKDDALLHVAEVMMELTEELRGVCERRSNEPPHANIVSNLEGAPKTTMLTDGLRRKVSASVENQAHSATVPSPATFQRGFAAKGPTTGMPAARERRGSVTQRGGNLSPPAPPTTPPRSKCREAYPIGETNVSPTASRPGVQRHATQQMRAQFNAQVEEDRRHSPVPRGAAFAASGDTRYPVQASPARRHDLCAHGVNATECNQCIGVWHSSRGGRGASGNPDVDVWCRTGNRASASPNRASVGRTHTPPSPTALCGNSAQSNSRTSAKGAAPSPGSAVAVAGPALRGSPPPRRRREMVEGLVDGLYANYHTYHDCVCGTPQRTQRGNWGPDPAKRAATGVEGGQSRRKQQFVSTRSPYRENTRRSPGASCTVRVADSLRSYAAGGGQARLHGEDGEDHTLHMSSLQTTGSSIFISPDSTAVYADGEGLDTSCSYPERRHGGWVAQAHNFRGTGREDSLRVPERRRAPAGRLQSGRDASGGLRGILRQQQPAQRQSAVTPTRTPSFMRFGTSAKRLPDVVSRTRVGKRDEF